MNPVSSQVWPSTLPVTGKRRGYVCTIHVSGNNVLIPNGTTQKIATLASGCAPLVDATALAGYSNGAWIMLRADTTGTISLYSIYANGNITLGTLACSLTFVC